MNKLTQLRTKEEYDRLLIKVQIENHAVLAPTHIMKKDGEIEGYFSIGAVPIVLPWFGTALSARDSAEFIQQGEVAFAERFSQNGPCQVIVPCPLGSPFFPLMGKLGFNDIGKYNLFIKEV